MKRETRRGQEKVLSTVQDLLRDELDEGTGISITPELIAEKISMVVTMNPRWGEALDREALIDELIRRFSLWIGQDALLKNDADHQSWLNASRKKNWHYWKLYQELLDMEMSPTTVDALDISTDMVLGLLEDPEREGPWDRRGLVNGHVQSGKTGHYTGLICKAADAGYKIIIVLAGLHKNLRSQTQVRLDEGFLGYETKPNSEELVPTGVGTLVGFDIATAPNFATNRSDNGDFNTALSRNLGISPEERPWLFVVKKNKTPLKLLLRWIQQHVADAHSTTITGVAQDLNEIPRVKKISTKFPAIIIDDEADNASVDTGETAINEDGSVNLEHDPKTINKLIRRIASSFNKIAYVGYTATPFANIFIHECNKTIEEGDDLFPSSFIANLAAPSNYIGPVRVFGVRSQDGRTGGLPLIRPVKDHVGHGTSTGWMPPKHKRGHIPQYEGRDELPPSLVEAVDAFLLVCAERSLRSQGNSHASMLIHVTRFKDVQKEVHRQVSEHLRRMHQRIHRGIDCDLLLRRLEGLWRRDFVGTTESIAALNPDLVDREPSEWSEVLRVLPGVIEDIQVRLINGTAKDVLDYAESGDIGLKVIAVGGDKLSRGLTLEGLCVSYFLRASKMYDTLMQMGRWFGYRPGYLDLCRLYTTSELVDWFGHIADASEELREEFDLMVASGADPRAYGLKVQSHPVLLVTSRLKMRAAKDLWLSFSGDISETVVFFKDIEKLRRNFLALEQFLESLGSPKETNPTLTRAGVSHQWGGHVWETVGSRLVVDFLSSYQTHPQSHKTISYLLAEFIQALTEVGELTDWTVALIGGGKGKPRTLAPGIDVRMQKRQDKGYSGRYSIGRLLDPPDESVDLDHAGWNAALEETIRAFHVDPGRRSGPSNREVPTSPSGPAIRRVRGKGAPGVPAHPERGLLLIYTLDPSEAGTDFPEGTPPVVGFGISFPASDSGLKVKYSVNNVLWQQWEQEYGGSE